MRSRNVDRLFLKDVFNIDLLELAKLMQEFQHIRYLELGLSLSKENQAAIARFFDVMKKTNPQLGYHLQVKLSRKIKSFEFITDYLSDNNIKVKSFTIIPEDDWVSANFLNIKKSSLKNAFDNCLRKICEKNYTLRHISMSGFLNDTFADDESGDKFNHFPLYNTQMYSMYDVDVESQKLLLRNMHINALRSVSRTIRHFQNMLESLPWLVMNNMPKEVVLNIFYFIKDHHALPDSTMDMSAWYNYKPHKKYIDNLKRYLQLDKIQEKVYIAITNWFDKRPDARRLHEQVIHYTERLAISCNNQLYAAKDVNTLYQERSQYPLIHQLDGIFIDEIAATEENRHAIQHFCEIINRLNCYQKALTIAMQLKTRVAYIAFQCHGPISNILYWNNLALQRFNALEFLEVLEHYEQHHDTLSKSKNFIKEICSKVFTDFTDEEKRLFKSIMISLDDYFELKNLGNNKHICKKILLDLIKPENIAILEKSRPRLYCILRTQHHRLAASIGKCSVKFSLKFHGLFSIQHQDNKRANTAQISSYIKNINEHLSKRQ